MSASYQDLLPAPQGWIHELARAELHPDAERLLQLASSQDPQQLVEEATIQFLTDLRAQLNEFARIFNGYSENGGRYQEVKIYSVAQTAADFMVYRNQVKLVFSNTAHGVIQIAFANHTRGTLAVDGYSQTAAQSQTSQEHAQELLAQLGPFRDVWFTFQGEKVRPEQVAKFYFAEFTRATRDGRKGKVSNQALVEQIRAILHEKGLDL